MRKNKPYTILAKVYSHLMRRIRYDKWADYLHKLVKDELGPDAECLEIAAGNGKFSEYFMKYFKNIVVTDLSLDFIKMTESTKSLVCCNMTALPFKKKFDLVYSNFDSVNYLLTVAELNKLFKEVNSVLKDNGIFTFDISLENNSYKHEKDVPAKERINGIRYSHLSRFDPVTRIHTNKFILKLANGEEYSEIHKQKIYPFTKYFDVISGSGLYVAECLETFTFRQGNPESDRIQFVLKKNKNASV